jgi:histidinol-phosphate aminotransferase
VSIKHLAKPQIARIKPYVPGKPFEEGKDILKLASNENLLGISEKVRQAICRAASNVYYYPDSDCTALAAKMAERMRLAPENFIFGNGAVDVLYYLSNVFIDRGTEVLVPWPSFPIFILGPAIYDGTVKRVPLTNYTIDLGRVADAVNDETRVVFLANPNNPTGTIFHAADFDRFIRRVDPKRTIVVMDEAYEQFVDDKDYPRTIPYIADYPNLIVLRTFAKIYGLAGLRIGMGIAQPEMIALLSQVRPPFAVNSLAQAALLAAMDDTEHVEKTRASVRETKEYIAREFDRMGVRYVPSQTNFLFVDVGADAAEFGKRMIERDVFVRPLGLTEMPTWLRVSMPSDIVGCKRFLEAFAESQEQLKQPAMSK